MTGWRRSWNCRPIGRQRGGDDGLVERGPETIVSKQAHQDGADFALRQAAPWGPAAGASPSFDDLGRYIAGLARDGFGQSLVDRPVDGWAVRICSCGRVFNFVQARQEATPESLSMAFNVSGQIQAAAAGLPRHGCVTAQVPSQSRDLFYARLTFRIAAAFFSRARFRQQAPAISTM